MAPAVEQLREKTLLMLPQLFGKENLTCFSPSDELPPLLDVAFAEEEEDIFQT
jgi:hypothetical protein